MNIVTLDFETYYDDDYTLKKLTTEEYIRDPRFEVLGCGWGDNTGLRDWIRGDHVASVLPVILHSADAVLCHHAQFDGLILSHHFHIRPAFWLDTLSMARLVVGNHLSVALDSLAKHYQLAGKTIDYASFKGKHWADLTAGEQSRLGSGCLHDVDLTWRLFGILMKEFPDEELRVIDMTVRMFTEPVLRGDIELLAKVWMDEKRRKSDLLRELEITSADLQSVERFAELLRAEGFEPETKVSPTNPEKAIFAFAKTDDFMKELIEDDGRAGALARARLGVRSTINQTRAERLGWMATRGRLPVYLRYSGAHTTRWSGGDALNWQNFPSGGDIRRAIKAPEGGALIVLDLAQIECIAEGQLVDTRDRGLVPIQDIVVDDFVWDGVEWVRHEGVVCKGEREVLTYDGLTATAEHDVYIAYGSRVELARAAKTGRHLRKTCPPMPLLQAALRSAELCRVQDLRRSGCAIPVPERASDGGLYTEGTAAPRLSWGGNRPQEQRWALRTGELETVDATGERQQSQHNVLGAHANKSFGDAGLQTSASRMWLQPGSDQSAGRAGTVGRGNHREVPTRSLESADGCIEAQEARPLQKVYDIVNAGPRHRFTVSGVLVSNCRMLNQLAGQTDVVEAFRDGRDLYSEGASRFYRREITRADKNERHLGKVLELGCGYGMGAIKLRATCRAGALGGPPIFLTEGEADDGIRTYRGAHPAVVAYWQTAGRMIARLAGGPPLEWGPMLVKDGRIYLPNGAWLNYTTLTYDNEWQAWKIKSRQGWVKLYGGKLVENVVQALARVVLSQAMLRIAAHGYKIATTTHDEVVIVADQWEAPGVYELCRAEMERPPAWLPDLPLKVEGGVSERYEK